jgi:CRISPR-associated protein Csb3
MIDHLDVDIRNPGQFFGACAILELAGRTWPKAEGWFDDHTFYLDPRCPVKTPIAELLDIIATTKPLVQPTSDSWAYENAKHAEDRVERYQIIPLMLKHFNLRLDWWLKPGGANERVIKLWSAHQTLWHPKEPEGKSEDARLIPFLQEKLCDVIKSHPDDRRILKRTIPLGRRLGVDPTSAWTAIDIGFPANQYKVEVDTSPATELLALIGFQGFRPQLLRDRRFEYTPWTQPLPLPVARAAAGGVLGGRKFIFELKSRGDFKYFGFAEEKDVDEHE